MPCTGLHPIASTSWRARTWRSSRQKYPACGALWQRQNAAGKTGVCNRMLFTRNAASHLTIHSFLGDAFALCMQLHKLCCNEDVSTVTSMSVATLHVQRNGQAIVDQSSNSNSTSGAITVIDYPGHERLRAGLKRQLASSAAVLCVIDTSDLANQVSVEQYVVSQLPNAMSS
jgi:Signal recognition particle receptor beta subunit